MKSDTKDVLIATLLQSTPAIEGHSYDKASSQNGCSNCSDGDPETPMVSLTFSGKSTRRRRRSCAAPALGYESYLTRVDEKTNFLRVTLHACSRSAGTCARAPAVLLFLSVSD